MSKEQGGEVARSEGGEMGTLFIMDLIRQKREKGLREKKDQKIMQMALEQKKKMAEGKKSSGGSNLYSAGGFVGIGQLSKSGGAVWTANKRKTVEEGAEHPAVQADSEMFILGLLKEQRQEVRDREHQEVCEESVACASDAAYMKKLER